MPIFTFPIISQWQRYPSFYPIGNLPIDVWMLYVKFGKKFENVDDGQRMPGYSISSPMSPRLR